MRVRIASVDYGDLLNLTLPEWVKLIPAESIAIVTNEADRETQRVASVHGAAVFITDAWTRHDATYATPDHWNGLWRERGRKDRTPILNKALALDEAFGFAGTRTPAPADGERCVSIDADCLPVGRLPESAEIAAGVLYGCKRYEGRADLTRGDEIVLKGRITNSQHRRATCVGGGYFQLFRYSKGLRFGSYPGADGYDYDFAFGFARGVELSCIHVLHFGETHANWEGRKTPRFVPQVSQ